MNQKRNNKEHTLFHVLFIIVEYVIHGISSALIWVSIGMAGFVIFQTKASPYDILIGLPLLLIGFGLAINSLSSIVYSIFSSQFNRGVCGWCN